MKLQGVGAAKDNKASRPTRGAWIEIMAWRWRLALAQVAPHTGRVD